VNSAEKRERWLAGYRHALAGGNLTEAAHLRQSFRDGYRVGCLTLRQLVARPQRFRLTSRWADDGH
jgi:hypothetical protein